MASAGGDVPLTHEKRTGHVNLMTKDDWLRRMRYEAAKSVQNGRQISLKSKICKEMPVYAGFQ